MGGVSLGGTTASKSRTKLILEQVDKLLNSLAEERRMIGGNL